MVWCKLVYDGFIILSLISSHFGYSHLIFRDSYPNTTSSWICYAPTQLALVHFSWALTIPIHRYIV